jgi:hypothetical protein
MMIIAGGIVDGIEAAGVIGIEAAEIVAAVAIVTMIKC